MIKASDFKTGTRLEFAKAHHKITRQRKSGRSPGLGELRKILGFSLIFLQRLKLATSNLASSWGFRRPIIKITPREKVGVAFG